MTSGTTVDWSKVSPEEVPYGLLSERKDIQELEKKASKDLEKSVTIPYLLKDKVLMSPGTWNGLGYSASEIEKAYKNSDWNDKQVISLFLDHEDNRAGEWIGYVKNPRYDDGTIRGDLEVVDKDTAMKLDYGAQFGISPKLVGDNNNGSMKDFSFENFSVVFDPAVKTAYINNFEVLNDSKGTVKHTILLNNDQKEGTKEVSKVSKEENNTDLAETKISVDDVCGFVADLSEGVSPEDVAETIEGDTFKGVSSKQLAELVASAFGKRTGEVTKMFKKIRGEKMTKENEASEEESEEVEEKEVQEENNDEKQQTEEQENTEEQEEEQEEQEEQEEENSEKELSQEDILEITAHSDWSEYSAEMREKYPDMSFRDIAKNFKERKEYEQSQEGRLEDKVDDLSDKISSLADVLESLQKEDKEYPEPKDEDEPEDEDEDEDEKENAEKEGSEDSEEEEVENSSTENLDTKEAKKTLDAKPDKQSVKDEAEDSSESGLNSKEYSSLSDKEKEKLDSDMAVLMLREQSKFTSGGE